MANQSKEEHEEIPGARKRLIICFDGTYDDTADTPERTRPGSNISRIARWILPPIFWQLLWVLRIFSLIKAIELKVFPRRTHDSGMTNISLLEHSIKPLGIRKDTNTGASEPVHQLVLYVGGIGSLGNPQSRVEEAATGNTLAYKIRYAYRFLVDNYRWGDEVFLFGYSRGGYTARGLADLLRWGGIIRRNDTELLDSLWSEFAAWRPTNPGDFRQSTPRCYSAQGADRCRTPVSVKCIGVWDTVGSFGPPPLFISQKDDIAIARQAWRRRGFVDTELRPHAEYSFHALALDERRLDFYPNVWSLTNLSNEARARFRQTWFCGNHRDIAGGVGCSHLNIFPFIWMVSKIKEFDLLSLDDEFIDEKVIGPVKGSNTPPWKIPIGPRNYLDRIPILCWLPDRWRDSVRAAHRNPNLLASAIEASGIDVEESLISQEQTLHWTVIDRVNKGNYLHDCPSLMKQVLGSIEEQERERIQHRMEKPVGKDKQLMEIIQNMFDRGE